jgi:hypothetical protein
MQAVSFARSAARGIKKLAQVAFDALIGIDDGDKYGEPLVAQELIGRTETVTDRVRAVEACVSRGVPVEFCLTRCRVAPPLPSSIEQARFAIWLAAAEDRCERREPLPPVPAALPFLSVVSFDPVATRI